MEKGVGLLTAPQFLKLSVNNDGSYVLEAWIKFAILPGVYVGEMGTKGFVGALPKQLLKERVDKHLWPCRLMLFINNNRQQFLISYKLFIGKEYYNGQDKEKGNYCR